MVNQHDFASQFIIDFLISIFWMTNFLNLPIKAINKFDVFLYSKKRVF